MVLKQYMHVSVMGVVAGVFDAVTGKISAMICAKLVKYY